MQETRVRNDNRRDIRLDFFRGLCLFFIFIAHTYGNPLARIIPARFGFSDATEVFVFCSGMASALAFGGAFARHGLIVGLGRVAYRIWQVYWAHVSVFLVAIWVTIETDRFFGGTGDFVRGLKFENLFNENAANALVGIMSLTWVPPYLDILPMYLVLLCMMPAVILVAERSRVLIAVICIGIWFSAQAFDLKMVSEPWSDASWFFNPFGWQLIFFTGFAIMRGWLPVPPANRLLIGAAIAYCLVSLPLEWEPLLIAFPLLAETREAIGPLIDKGKLGILRYLHFLALAYLAVVLVGEQGRHLRGPVVAVIAKVGQQSLGVFMAGLILSLLAGPAMLYYSGHWAAVVVVNGVCFAALVAVAYGVAWFKAAPWTAPRPATPGRGHEPKSRDGRPQPDTAPPKGVALTPQA
ncbi:MAG: OpgC family protein [Hyphomicrobiaceae bacterium]